MGRASKCMAGTNLPLSRGGPEWGSKHGRERWEGEEEQGSELGQSSGSLGAYSPGLACAQTCPRQRARLPLIPTSWGRELGVTSSLSSSWSYRQAGVPSWLCWGAAGLCAGQVVSGALGRTPTQLGDQMVAGASRPSFQPWGPEAVGGREGR